ncbi:MAG: hypothetical protein AAFY28_07650 [Actinomycetota bacterium]
MSDSTTDTDAQTLFWDLIDELQIADDRVHEGRIMSSRCARVDGEFLALYHKPEWGLVVKLPRDRVTELVEREVGRPFRPNGKVFREWVSIPDVDADTWRALLGEGVAFVAPRA